MICDRCGNEVDELNEDNLCDDCISEEEDEYGEY